MKVTVEFTKSFSNKEKGDIESYDSMLASTLINVKKVAKKRVRKTTKKVEE